MRTGAGTGTGGSWSERALGSSKHLRGRREEKVILSLQGLEGVSALEKGQTGEGPAHLSLESSKEAEHWDEHRVKGQMPADLPGARARACTWRACGATAVSVTSWDGVTSASHRGT